MKIKAKQIFLVGAFIVLTLIGYIILPKDEIVIDFNEGYDNLASVSGEEKMKEEIYVHIEGAVNIPGVKAVEKGTRVFELIDMAGGALEDADLSKINLASILKDEQKVYVPYKMNLENTCENDLTENSVKVKGNGLVNINTADNEELQQLEGIGPSMAQKILDYREENGYFSSIEQIKSVSGIGESKFNKIKEEITI